MKSKSSSNSKAKRIGRLPAKLLKLLKKQFTVGLAAYRIKKSLSKNERGLFVDCGSNLGQGFKFFSRFFPLSHFDYELFEPNPNCIKTLRLLAQKLGPNNIQINEKAASTDEGILSFYGTAESEGGPLSQGGSLVEGHNSALYTASKQQAIQVETIDFSSYIARKSKTYKSIVVKMDIEGAELDVLEKMLLEKTINKVKLIFIEFHSHFSQGKHREASRQRELKILNALKENNTNYQLWE